MKTNQKMGEESELRNYYTEVYYKVQVFPTDDSRVMKFLPGLHTLYRYCTVQPNPIIGMPYFQKEHHHCPSCQPPRKYQPGPRRAVSDHRTSQTNVIPNALTIVSNSLQPGRIETTSALALVAVRYYIPSQSKPV